MQEEATLRSLCGNGKSDKEISRALPGRSPDAVGWRRRVLGVLKRSAKKFDKGPISQCLAREILAKECALARAEADTAPIFRIRPDEWMGQR